jgi:hypothetical protein
MISHIELHFLWSSQLDVSEKYNTSPIKEQHLKDCDDSVLFITLISFLDIIHQPNFN